MNLIPYYGNPSPQELPYIYRSQVKNGTCSFYAYATLYVIKKGKRVTLAIKAVRRFDTLVAIITYLLVLIEPLKLGIKRLYLDRGFFCVAVIRWLQALKIHFVMPVIIRGKQGGAWFKNSRFWVTLHSRLSHLQMAQQADCKEQIPCVC